MIVATDELVLVVPADHRLARRGSATLHDLTTQPLIVREPGSGTRHCLESALESKGISPRELTIALEVNSNQAIRSAVERGLGVSFLSSSALEDDRGVGNAVAVKIRGFRPRRHLYVVTAADRPLAAPVHEFLALVQEYRSKRRGSS